MNHNDWASVYARSSDREECPPSADLALLAAGDVSPEKREEVLTHIERCADCSNELAMAMETKIMLSESESMIQQAPSTIAAPPPWFALAATLILGIGVGVMTTYFVRGGRSPDIQPNVVIADLLPADNQLRGAGDTEVIVPAQSTWFTLVLATTAVPDFQEYRAEITSTGNTRNTVIVNGLKYTPFEPFTVGLPTAELPQGDYDLLVFGVAESDVQEIGRYAFSLRYQ